MDAHIRTPERVLVYRDLAGIVSDIPRQCGVVVRATPAALCYALAWLIAWTATIVVFTPLIMWASVSALGRYLIKAYRKNGS